MAVVAFILIELSMIRWFNFALSLAIEWLK